MKLPARPDPFDHRQCGHAEPVFPLRITDTLELDLVNILHTVWLAIQHGDLNGALEFIEDLGRWVEMAALGYTDEVDNEVGRVRTTFDELKTLKNNEAFDAELRKLMGDE